MKILALERENPGFLPEEMAPFLKAEARKVWELRQRKIITEIYFTQEDHTAVLVLDCHDAGTARLHLGGLPLVANGFIRFELHTLGEYTGFSRLFEEQRVFICLRSSWSKLTSSKWIVEKPECGQCSVTALVLHDLFGGEILKTRVNGSLHFYNRINGEICDFTRTQFDQEIVYEHLRATWEEAMDDTSPCQFQALRSSFQACYFEK